MKPVVNNRPGMFDSGNIQTHHLCPVLTKGSSCDPQPNSLRLRRLNGQVADRLAENDWAENSRPDVFSHAVSQSKVVAPNLLLFSLFGRLLCSPWSGVSRPIVKHRIFYQAPRYFWVGVRSAAKTSRPSACKAIPPLGFFIV